MSAYLVACSSSSGDDSSVADSGSDTSIDNYVPPSDGSTADTGVDAGCTTCAQGIQTGPFNLCTDNGPPSSQDLTLALVACECDVDAGCGVACADNCADPNNPPSTDCQNCVPTNCAAEVSACLADDGTDAGHAPSDAGDGGD